MIITLKAHPRSKFEKIIEHEGIYHCYFNVVPKGGKANAKVVEMLSDYFKVSKSNIVIKFGTMGPEKVIEIKG